MQIFNVENHEPSLLPEGKKWKLVWNDEFDGSELDKDKWDFRLTMMGERWPGWTDKKGIELDGKSNAVFTLCEDDGKPVSVQLQTGYNFMDEPLEETKFGEDRLQWRIGKLHENKFTHRYGYYECRCKLQKTDGWWSAFWIQSPVIGSTLNPSNSGTEIDIMECFRPGEIAGHNAFTGGYGKDMKNEHVGGMKGLDTDEYHYFGLLWDKTGYTFYIDGKEDGRITNYVSDVEQFILLTTEPKGYRLSSGERKASKEAYASIGDKFYVDHIRVFDEVTDNEN